MKRLSSRGVMGWGVLGNFLGLAVLAMLLAAPVYGQGVLVVINPPQPVPLPRPIIRPPRRVPPPVPMSYKIKELAVQARVVDQVARVQVSQSFVNTGSRQMEVCFVFPLPYDGAVDRLTFMVDGREIEAKLLPAKEARSIYESYVRRNQDPALLEWIGTGMFKTSVFPVPPGAERKVSLRYSQILRKDRQLTDFLFPLSTAKYTSKPLEKISIRVTIESSAKIKSVYSPTHSVNIKRPDANHAVVRFEAQNQVPVNDFRLFYDIAKGSVGASLLSYRPDVDEDGYFLLLASPEIKAKREERPKKNVIFVVDRSGSMSGKKIEQAKDALRFVFNNLREGDLFNIVAYDSSVESFRPELQRYTEETRKAALGFIEGIYAGGSTNIDSALSSALGMIQDSSRPNFVIFLTDGRPTAGETKEPKIAANAKKRNQLRARLISLGVGYDVNSRLLDRLSYDNHGKSEYVRPDEDIEEHVSRLYNRISSPVMTEVVIDIDVEGSKVEQGSSVNRVYPREVRDLFEGEQLVLVGRYRRPGDAKVTIRGKVGAKKQKLDFPADMVDSSADESYAFVEKLWAMRRIGDIIDELDLHGKNEELVKELVMLSTKHGILTPYTSFLADENASPADLADVGRGTDLARRQLMRLSEAEGLSAFAQRAEKATLKSADRPATAAPLAQTPTPGRGGFGAANQSAAGALGGARYRDIEEDKEVVVSSVQSVGKLTLYKRGQLWIASTAQDVDLKKDAQKIKKIKRFSDEYFRLTADNTASENMVLARQQAGEQLLIKLRGNVYLIE